MQVKKFEARSMKEALEMIKREFGPEAIILSAKDNSQRYGLVGEGSVEVTAAISDSSLQKKKFIETKLPDHLKENFSKAPARSQKEWVEKLVNLYRQENEAEKKRQETQKAIRERRYIDIVDDLDIDKIRESQSNQAPVINAGDKVHQLEKELEELKSLVKSLKLKQPETTSSLNIPIELVSIFEKLKGSGLREEYALNLLDLAKKKIPSHKFGNKGLVEGWLVNYILENTKVSLPTKKVQLFMGPSGSGKTTLLVKWATHLIMRQKKKVGILTADQLKLGAVQQMRMYAQILNAPFVSITKKSDWSYVLSELSSYDHLLCDFFGSSLQSSEESDLLYSRLPDQDINCDKHIVLNAANSHNELNQIFLKYKPLQPNTISFTRLDETKKRGYLFEMSNLHRIPIFALSMGQKIPDDFEIASQERIVDFVLQISSSGGLDAFR